MCQNQFIFFRFKETDGVHFVRLFKGFLFPGQDPPVKGIADFPIQPTDQQEKFLLDNWRGELDLPELQCGELIWVFHEQPLQMGGTTSRKSDDEKRFSNIDHLKITVKNGIDQKAYAVNNLQKNEKNREK